MSLASTTSNRGNASTLPSAENAPHAQSSNIRTNWKLIDLKLGIMFLRSLYATGLAPDEALEELARLQPRHADFWRGAARHTRSGKSLHSYLQGRWSDSLVSPIRIAEASGRLQEVFLGMEQTLQQQIEANKLLSKIYYPISIFVSGIAVAIFFISTVIPAMIGRTRFDKQPAIVTFSKWAQTFTAEYGLLVLGGLFAVIAAIVWKWFQDETLKNATLRLINRVPVLGWCTRWLWFSVWSNYVAIMIRADIPFAEIFRMTAKTLPAHLQVVVSRITTHIENGKSLTQAATPSKDADDPRHMLPLHIVNAFRMTDRSGNGAKQFATASETLFEPGKTMLMHAITTINYIAMIVSAAIITVPMLMYLQAIAAMTKTAMR
jgi:type II secretory pathway component PulF